jgi:hypothetical protein
MGSLSGEFVTIAYECSKPTAIYRVAFLILLSGFEGWKCIGKAERRPKISPIRRECEMNLKDKCILCLAAPPVSALLRLRALPGKGPWFSSHRAARLRWIARRSGSQIGGGCDYRSDQREHQGVFRSRVGVRSSGLHGRRALFSAPFETFPLDGDTVASRWWLSRSSAVPSCAQDASLPPINSNRPPIEYCAVLQNGH